jgi:hypothetical protein
MKLVWMLAALLLLALPLEEEAPEFDEGPETGVVMADS